MDLENEESQVVVDYNLVYLPALCFKGEVRGLTSMVVCDYGIIPVQDVQNAYILTDGDIIFGDNGLPLEIRKEGVVFTIVERGAFSYLTC